MPQQIPCYYINPKDGAEMVLVPGGWFWMGSDDSDSEASGDEKPGHLHYLDPFYISIACVTVAQFKQFMKDTGHKNTEDRDKDPDDHPVRYVNWHDATAYCKWADLRLPHEAEWELACRGYNAWKYPWGNDWEGGKRVCWDNQKGPEGNTAPIFDHPEGVSGLGTFQQSGNLWEWCNDEYDSDAYKRYARGDFKTPDGTGSRVLRGGSWHYSDAKYFRGAFRNNDNPENRYYYNGFRSARTITF